MDKAHAAAARSAARCAKRPIATRRSRARTCSTRRSGARRSHYGDAEGDARLRAQLTDWCVTPGWFETRAPDCRLMHCLPVRRNVAVADEVLDGPRSVVQREAYNRLPAQMAVLHRMLRKGAAMILTLPR